MSNLNVNAFRAYLASSLQSAGSETIFYLDRITTLNGETITTADFSTFARGVVTIDPLSATDIEFASFTTVDSTNIALTGGIRGLSAKGNTSSTGRMPYHPVGTPVIISFGVHNIEDIKAYMDGLIIGTIGSASKTTSGTTKMTEAQNSKPRAMGTLVSELASPGLTLTVSPFSFSSLTADVDYTGGTSGTFTAPVSNPRIDLLVYSTTGSALAIRSGAEAVSPTKPTPTDGDIVLAQIYNRVGQTTILEQDDSTNGYIKRWYNPSIYLSTLTATPPGLIAPYAGYTAPTNWLLCDGSAVSRTTYANLFAALCPSGTTTVTIATPGVFTKTAHGYLAGEQIHFSTTGALPTGLLTATTYYVIAAGLTTDAFQVALSPNGPAINTSGTQSGVHTVYRSAFGIGDGSTTFTLPDLRSRFPVGLGVGTSTLKIDSTNLTLASPGVWTCLADCELSQGQAVVLTTTGALPTGYSLATTYYVIRASQTATSFRLASSLNNANAGTGINTSGSQSGVHTLTYTPTSSRTVLGRTGGEETHSLSTDELQHSTAGSTEVNGAAANTPQNVFTGLGGATSTASAHNLMSPFVTTSYIIKT